MDAYLRCDECGETYSVRQPLTVCPGCGGFLEACYDWNQFDKDHMLEEGLHSIWRYKKFFPAMEDKNIISLGEGCTPLTKAVHLNRKLGIEHIYFKNDTMMPTGSFKDRGFSLAVSYAKELGIRAGLTYSSGNAGASFSAYSGRGGFQSVVLVEYIANPVKIAMIKLYGADTAVLKYNNFSEISQMLEDLGQQLKLYQFINFINPLRHEAMKTYAYELWEELGFSPDAIFHPVGTGGGLWGCCKGFSELGDLGVVDRRPRMFGVQPAAAAHFREAFDRGSRIASSYGDCTKTIAQSIASDSPLQGGRRVLKAIYDTGGAALGVSDEEIMEAMKDLAREGVGAEPSSAAAVAGMKQAAKKGLIHSDDKVVCVITGSLLKQPAVIRQAAGKPLYTVNADVESVRKLLQSLTSQERGWDLPNLQM